MVGLARTLALPCGTMVSNEAEQPHCQQRRAETAIAAAELDNRAPVRLHRPNDSRDSSKSEPPPGQNYCRGDSGGLGLSSSLRRERWRSTFLTSAWKARRRVKGLSSVGPSFSGSRRRRRRGLRRLSRSNTSRPRKIIASPTATHSSNVSLLNRGRCAEVPSLSISPLHVL